MTIKYETVRNNRDTTPFSVCWNAGVTRIVDRECDIRYYANFKSFDQEFRDVGGQGYRYNHKNGILEFIDSRQQIVNKYAPGWGFAYNNQEISKNKDELYFYDSYYGETNKWYRVYHDKLFRFPGIKVWHNYMTVFDGVKYFVIDNNGYYIIPPGKYDYIDGFKYGYARVMIKKDIVDSDNDSGYRCGIVDSLDCIIVPIEYTHLEDFFSQGKTSICICEGGLDCNEQWQSNLYYYKYDILTNKKELEGDCYYGHYHDYMKDNPDYSEEYYIWDAIDGEAEAAGNIDYEW